MRSHGDNHCCWDIPSSPTPPSVPAQGPLHLSHPRSTLGLNSALGLNFIPLAQLCPVPRTKHNSKARSILWAMCWAMVSDANMLMPEILTIYHYTEILPPWQNLFRAFGAFTTRWYLQITSQPFSTHHGEIKLRQQVCTAQPSCHAEGRLW